MSAMCSIQLYFIVCISTSFGPCRAILNSAKVSRSVGAKVILSKSDTGEVDLTPMIFCVKTIAGKFFHGKKRVPVMVPSFLDSSRNLDNLFPVLEERLIVYSVTENFTRSKIYLESRSAIVLLKNSTEFELLGDLTELCAPRCRYVFPLTTIYNDEDSFLAEADAMVKAAWKKWWIIKIVVVASAGGKFLVAGTQGFETDTFEVPAKPEVLGECDTLSTQPKGLIFGDILMNKSRVNVTLFDCPPYAFINDKNRIAGVEGEMVEAVAESLGMTLNRLNISSDEDLNITRYDNLINVLENQEESDIVFCGLYWNISNVMESSLPYEMEKVIWLVPSTPSLTLLGLITPLQSYVWFAIIGLLVFTGLMKVLFFKKISFLGVVGLILGIALPRQPRILSNRIQFVSLVLFGYVITQSYLASLAGQLMNTNYHSIETMKELVDSGMMFGGTARHRNLFKVDESSTSQKIYEEYRTLELSEYDETMTALKNLKNSSIALVEELKISHYRGTPGPYDPHELKELLAGYPVALAVWKGLPYLDQINAKISRLIESGLVNHWSVTYANLSASDIEIALLGLDTLHLSPSFLLLLIGHAFGSIVFLIEIGIYAKKSNQFNKKKQGRGKKRIK